MMKIPCAIAIVTGGLIAAVSACAADGDAVAEVSTFDNAAYDYWRAAALIQEVLNESQFDAVLFTEQELPGLPPRAFAYAPEAGRWLLNERLMLEALHEGAGKSSCAYAREGDAQAVSLYRGAIQRITLRALASAKAHEFVGNARAAGSIYADVLRMLRHQDEGGDWDAVNFTLSLYPALLTDIEGFVSRLPPRDAVERIVRELEAGGHPRFPIAPRLAHEVQTYSDWLTSDPAQVEGKVAGLYRDAIVKPALSELLQLEPDEDAARVEHWVKGYQEEVEKLKIALRRPYPEAIRTIREIDGMIAGAAREKLGNPLLPLLMPPMVPTYERFVAIEAHLNMVELLCRGAIYQDFVGGWPDNLEILAQFSGGTLPPDPFTGGDMAYDLRGELPRVEVDAPKSVRDADAVTEINLRTRLHADEEALGELVRNLQRKKRANEAIAVPQQEPGEASGDPRVRNSRLRGGR